MTNGIIIVLGSPNDEFGNLSTIAVERCKRAIELYKVNPGYKILLTGGSGSHFNKTSRPHAFYLKLFLTKYGIPSKDILEFAESRNTLEDAILSKSIVMKNNADFIVVVTSDYHVERARYIFEREYSDSNVRLFFVGSKTDEEKCDQNLEEIKKHELKALTKLKNIG